ncbi:hypothetical protein KOR34_27350 [Posidoniimonas corsicana]|uniref:Carboxypeptidase regulatory-like domain-containing protein n=1 Tax=Posidoniimonas corsicana TaxID=1938618 RepID=A0A5C5VJ87_9BACT|nr:CehA/McbA family metallohydrolase [Posidoniimonas corsicana]TWT37772.1 hypothetical protein KOR34_27350 [Posidoniimonas corsicana]
MPTKSAALTLCLACCLPSYGAELLTLTSENFTEAAPRGKEADAIYGDYVLRNDKVVATVAAPHQGRHANLTVLNVGGGVIDLTQRDRQSDQLSCFYPGDSVFRLHEVIDWPEAFGTKAEGAARIAFAGAQVQGKNDRSAPLQIRVGYELRDGEDFLRVTSDITNPGDSPAKVQVRDGLRVDKGFRLGSARKRGLWWAYDQHWRQAYGLVAEDDDRRAMLVKSDEKRRPHVAAYPLANAESAEQTLPAGGRVAWSRRLIPAADTLELFAHSAANPNKLRPVAITVTDGADPVASARVVVRRNGKRLGEGLTDSDGRLATKLPADDYEIRVRANGHQPLDLAASVAATQDKEAAGLDIQLSKPAYVSGVVTDDAGHAIACKVQFTGLGDTPSPRFGPDTAVRGVVDLQYTPDGRFQAKLLPGRYRWIASHGPEYDAAQGELTIAEGETADVEASLRRSVDTTGWLSSELHSHSSPSGDNTSSQRGRVLNLLAEHLEFCPCTEHQRIDTYDEHLAHFDAVDRMLTCAGMELTGKPLPLNHQNAFPLIKHEHRQHNGGPLTNVDPVAQIQRLAAWDNNSEKLIQTNHPNVAQMIGDRDLDGVADEGFEAMFGYMDVMEVHPLDTILQPLGPAGEADNGVGSGGLGNRGNTIVNWLQLLNLGYRVTGVVNTDAHYNHHGSGWLRNWVKSSTDDPAQASVIELVHEFEHGHVVMSNGPFLQVVAESDAQDRPAIPGDDLKAADGKARVRITVRRPNWLEINRVQLLLNGRAVEQHNYTARDNGEMFAAGPEVFSQTIELDLDADTHLVVIACGEDRQLGAVYGEKEGAVMPIAVSNPVFIDTDGDANQDGAPFEPNGDDLGLPLPRLEGAKPSHGHDHHNHRH